MNIQGKYPIAASTSDVWDHLMDPNVLKRITPGISELHHLEGDKYKAVSNIKIGPVKGNFEGELELVETIENREATLLINQTSKIGNVTAEINIRLDTNDDGTEIVYDGEAKLSGKLAMMGQRIIGGVVNTISKQFFKSLNNEINS